jgi:hypothetical protein
MRNKENAQKTLRQAWTEARSILGSSVLRLIVLGLALFVTVIVMVLAYRADETLPNRTETYLILVASATMFYVVFGDLMIRALHLRQERQKAEQLPERLQQLTDALSIAAATVTEIEAELEKRREIVGQLETQKAIAERAIELTGEQVEAVASILRFQITAQSKRDFRAEIARDILFFVLGVAASYILNRLGAG